VIEVSGAGRRMNVVLSRDTRADELKLKLEELAKVVQAKATKWVISYDMSSMTSMDVLSVQAMIDFHKRVAGDLERVGFCAGVPILRGNAIVIGSSVRSLPWKVFATREQLHRWADAEVTP
jgi:hypothetical protein